MAKKIIQFNSKARQKVQKGVRVAVNAVKHSYGPGGGNAILGQSYGAPNICNDGVTIVKAIELEGVEQLGVLLVQQAANQTNEVAGDGTSTATILTGALVDEGLKVIEAGSDAIKVRIGLKKAEEFVLQKLNELAVPVTRKEDKANVATISSRSREIGEMIADALEKVGNEGAVSVQTGDSNKTEIEITQGMQFDRGYKSPYFVTDPAKMEAVVDKPLILVTDRKISSLQEIVQVIEQMAQNGRKDLLLIAEDIEGEALASAVLNKVRGIFNFFAVQAPAFGDRRKAILEDIAVLTGATFISSDLGMQLKDVKYEDLGSADKVIITKDTTTIVGGHGSKEAVQRRADTIRAAIVETKNDYDRQKNEERLAKLVGGVAVIKVGASTEVELKEKKYVIEDAVNATKAAIAEGIVPGGATTLVRLAKALESYKLENEEEQIGVNILRKALLVPFRTIAENSGVYDLALIQKHIEKSDRSGYDFKELKEVDDMLAYGIIDPKKVLREAISNSVSIAGGIITTRVVVCDEPKTDKNNSSTDSDMNSY